MSISDVLDKIEDIYFVEGCSISIAIRLGVEGLTEKDLKNMGVLKNGKYN